LETYRRVEGLTAFIAAGYRHAAEIGIGPFPDVAYALTERGLKVFATDIKPFEYDGLKVIVDDITGPEMSLYCDVDLIYSMRPPPELIPYMMRLAETVSADLIIKPLSSEFAEGFSLMGNGDMTFFVRNNTCSNICGFNFAN
jgi:hypothetical protein